MLCDILYTGVSALEILLLTYCVYMGYIQMMRSSTSAANFISCCCLLLTTSLVDGQAVISVVEPLNIVAHRPGQFTLTIQKTGLSKMRVTIIVEVYHLQLIIIYI